MRPKQARPTSSRQLDENSNDTKHRVGRLNKTLFIGAIATFATCGSAHAQTARTGFEMMTDRKTSDAEERQRTRLEQERQRERRPLPPEVLVDGGAWRVIRRRQMVDDMLALESQ